MSTSRVCGQFVRADKAGKPGPGPGLVSQQAHMDQSQPVVAVRAQIGAYIGPCSPLKFSPTVRDWDCSLYLSIFLSIYGLMIWFQNGARPFIYVYRSHMHYHTPPKKPRTGPLCDFLAFFTCIRIMKYSKITGRNISLYHN